MEIAMAGFSGLLIGIFFGAWNYRDKTAAQAEAPPALLELREGDKLIINCKGSLSQKQVLAIKQAFVGVGEFQKILVLPEDFRLSVIRGLRLGSINNTDNNGDDGEQNAG